MYTLLRLFIIPMREIIKPHLLVLVFALLVSVVYGSHHFFISQFFAEDGVDYYPIAFSGTSNDDFDEATVYGPRANAVFQKKSFIPIGDINLVEYGNDTSTLFPMLPPLIMGGVALLAGSVSNAVIVSDFLFPPLIFIALYFLFFELTQRKKFSLIAAVIFIFAPKIALYIPPVSLYVLGEFIDDLFIPTSITDRLYFSRFEPPQLTYLFYLSALYFSLRTFTRKEKYVPILAGVSVGVLFYTYLHDWTYLVVALPTMFLLFLFQKDIRQAKRAVSILCVGFLVSVPYWFNFFELHNLSHYEDIVTRMGKAATHSFNFEIWKTYLRSGVLALLLWLCWRHRSASRAAYLVGLILPIFVLMNIQVLVGFTVADKHWYDVQYITIFMSFMMLAVWLYEKLLKNTIPDHYTAKVGWIVVIFVFVTQIYSQYDFSKVHAKKYIMEDSYAEGYNWLNNNTSSNSVVGTLSPETNSELLLYTHNKVYIPNGVNTLASNEELWDRLMILSHISGVTLKTFDGFLSEFDYYVVPYLFHHHTPLLKNDSLSPAVYTEKIQEYNRRLAEQKERISYILDYLYVGPREEQVIGNLSSNEMALVYENKNTRVYEFLDR